MSWRYKEENTIRYDLLMLLGYLGLYPLVYKMDNGGPRPASTHSGAFADYRAKHHAK